MSGEAPSLFVAVPAYDGVEPECVNSLLGLQIQCVMLGLQATFALLPRIARVTAARNRLAAMFLEGVASHLLFVDADVEFDAKTVARMLEHERRYGVGVVAAPVPMKNGRGETSTRIAVGPDGQVEVRDGFVRAELAATGLMLVARNVFDRMHDVVPEYEPGWGEQTARLYFDEPIVTGANGKRIHESEDYAFCRRWRALGGEVSVDATAKVRHWGACVYEAPTLLDVLQQGRLPRSHPNVPEAAHGCRPAFAREAVP